MRKKIIGIFVCMLIISTTFPVLAIEINKECTSFGNEESCIELYSSLDPPQSLPIWWLGLDQKQDKTCNSGYPIYPPIWSAQEFKPSKEKLIGIKLWMFKHGNPPEGIEITVAIRDSLNGNDLSVINLSADPIKRNGTWVLFDFVDITVIPENTYYIICRSNGGNGTDAYCWLFNFNNTYDRGIAWQSYDEGATWFDLEDLDPERPMIDFCFKTYSSIPRIKSFIFNDNFFSFLFNKFSSKFILLKILFGY